MSPRHDQRTSPKPKAAGEDTSWIPAFTERLRNDGVTTIVINDQFAKDLSLDIRVQEQKLRKLSMLGILRMSKRNDDNGRFLMYVWKVL